MQHLDDVGQVVLALCVVGPQAAKAGGKHTPVEAVDRGSDLGDRQLGVARVALFNDLGDLVAVRSHDHSRSRWVLHDGGQQRRRRVVGMVLFHECDERRRANERCIARQDDHVVVIEQVVVGKHRVSATATASPRILGEGAVRQSGCPSRWRLFRRITLVISAPRSRPRRRPGRHQLRRASADAWITIGSPQRRCSGLGSSDLIRRPSPAASTTADSERDCTSPFFPMHSDRVSATTKG